MGKGKSTKDMNPEELEQSRVRQRRFREKNIDHVRKYARDYYHKEKHTTKWVYLKYKYGLTKEEYLRLWTLQNGECAICRRVPTNKYYSRNVRDVLCVDHNHDTGKVRGLLCRQCNVGLSYIERTPTFTQDALSYLAATN